MRSLDGLISTLERRNKLVFPYRGIHNLCYDLSYVSLSLFIFDLIFDSCLTCCSNTAFITHFCMIHCLNAALPSTHVNLDSFFSLMHSQIRNIYKLVNPVVVQ